MMQYPLGSPDQYYRSLRNGNVERQENRQQKESTISEEIYGRNEMGNQQDQENREASKRDGEEESQT